LTEKDRTFLPKEETFLLGEGKLLPEGGTFYLSEGNFLLEGGTFYLEQGTFLPGEGNLASEVELGDPNRVSTARGSGWVWLTCGGPHKLDIPTRYRGRY
jgi:hypothetical protein